ncbi:MAG: putative fatty-acid--CoA ligase [Solirubrobacterales bacterium]|nr:putative fatty-acid--CoA ligase [Solirubrobacterales bacterium]
MQVVEPCPRGRNPFDDTGVVRDADGIARYTDRPASIVHMLRTSVDRDAGAIALVEVGGPSVGYGELWDRAARVAGGLQAEGVQRGDRVAIRLHNGIDWVLAFFGVQMLGAVAVPVNTRFAEDEVAYVVEDSGASYVFAAGAPLPDGEEAAIEELAPEDLSAIFYTSGTTGFPKGAMTSHGNFTTNSENAFRCLFTDRSEGPEISTLVSVPLFHVTGCNSQLLPMLEVGGRVEILSGPLDFEGFFTAVGSHGVNQLVSVPAIYHAVIGNPAFAGLDVSGVRWVSYGGAPIAESLVDRIKEAFPNARVGNGFGLTETSSLTSFLPHEEAADHADSVGFAMPVVDLALHEPGGPDSDEGVGELLVRGPNVVQGYWNKPQATAETFVDGWLHTGDVARIDDDGLLYIVDRKKDMINRGGENVYSIEVENALAGAPGVGEAAVVGVPDEMMGEKVGAVIVPAGPSRLDVEAVLDHCRAHLADFKVPQYISVREDPLPRNPGGKLLKKLLRDETDWGSPLR